MVETDHKPDLFLLQELLVPFEQPSAPATSAVPTVARTNPLAASSVPVPAHDASIRRAAALGRGPGVLAPAVPSQAAVAGPVAVEAREQLESVPVAVPPLSSDAAEQLTVPIQSSAAEGMADVAVHDPEWDDGGWPEPQVSQLHAMHKSYLVEFIKFLIFCFSSYNTALALLALLYKIGVNA